VVHCKVWGHSVVSCAKTAEPIEMQFGLWTRMGPRKHELHGAAHWRQLAKTTEPSNGIHVRRRCGLSVKLLGPLVTCWRSIVISTSVCVSVCLSASISPEPHARSLPIFLCMLSMAVARSSSGIVTKSQGECGNLGVVQATQKHSQSSLQPSLPCSLQKASLNRQ